MNGNGQESESESEFIADRNRLRSRWELASVLNFFKVFKPIIGSDLKITADDVESALVRPNKFLGLLHISLLKGIPPVSKNLKDPDAWVAILSKKLFMWWPWVAEGDFPLTAAKGAEMETYKNLDPTVRLVILKALCEIRADQHDVVAFINDEVRNKKEISTFRKNSIGEDGKGTSYWLDGNETIGLRLYKEVNTIGKNGKLPTVSFQWETLATDLEEFKQVVEEYSSSKSKLEVAVGAVLETEAIPVLVKVFKKRQKEMEKKMNEERIMNNFCRSGITRSCRSRKPIRYTFDEYDKAISEAIRGSKRLKTGGEQKSEKKETAVNVDPPQAGESDSTGSDENDVREDSGEESDDEKVVSEDSGDDEKAVSEDSGDDENVVSGDSAEESDEENVASEDSADESDENDEDDNENMNINSSKDRKMKDQQENEESESEEEGESTGSDSESSESETKDISENEDDNKENKNNGSKVNSKNSDRSIQKQMDNFGTKKRLVQRPNRNTAIESAIVPDSDDDISSDDSDN